MFIICKKGLRANFGDPNKYGIEYRQHKNYRFGFLKCLFMMTIYGVFLEIMRFMNTT